MYQIFFSFTESWGIRLAHLYEISPEVTMNGLILSFNYLGAKEKLVWREKAYNNPNWGWGRVCLSCWSKQINLSALDGLGTLKVNLLSLPFTAWSVLQLFPVTIILGLIILPSLFICSCKGDEQHFSKIQSKNLYNIQDTQSVIPSYNDVRVVLFHCDLFCFNEGEAFHCRHMATRCLTFFWDKIQGISEVEKLPTCTMFCVFTLSKLFVNLIIYFSGIRAVKDMMWSWSKHWLKCIFSFSHKLFECLKAFP